MLTLDEAVAWLDKMLELHLKPCGEPDCGECLRDTRAAVRDVAIEAMRQMQERSGYVWEGAGELKAEINRLLGDYPHG